MKVTISFRNIKSSEAVEQKIRDKCEKIGKFFNDQISIKWTSHFNEGRYHSEAKVFGPKFQYHAHSHSDNMYKAFDLLAEKLSKQIQNKKEMWKNKIHHKHGEERPVILDPEIAWAEKDEDLAS